MNVQKTKNHFPRDSMIYIDIDYVKSFEAIKEVVSNYKWTKYIDTITHDRNLV